MTLIFNHDDRRQATRMADDDPAFAIACYEGAYDPETGRWEGLHQGVTHTPEDAKAWVDGENVSLVRIRWEDFR